MKKISTPIRAFILTLCIGGLTSCYTGVEDISTTTASTGMGTNDTSTTTGSSSRMCQATPNGVVMEYPCDTNQPTEPNENTVLAGWAVSEENTENQDHDSATSDFRQFIVESYATTLSPDDWVNQHTRIALQISDLIPDPTMVSGWPAIQFEIVPSDGMLQHTTTKYTIVQNEEKDRIYLITASASQKDPSIRQQYLAQLEAMLSSLKLQEAK